MLISGIFVSIIALVEDYRARFTLESIDCHEKQLMGGINCILIENLLTVLMCAAKHSRPKIRAVEENYLAVEGTWAFLFTCCLKDPLRWT